MHFRPIGACIYCGRTDTPLSKEHIVAYGLGGVDVLPEASCAACRDLTSKFEGIVARDMFGNLRVKENYPTRHKERRPTELPAKYFNADGEPRLAKLLVSKYPLHFPTITFPHPPGFAAGVPERAGNPEMHIGGQVDSASLGAAMEELKTDTMVLSWEIDWTAYCQTLAKTAHSLVCALVGIKGWSPLLPPLMRLEVSCFGHYIGGDPHPLADQRGGASVTWEQIADDQILAVYLEHLGRLKIPLCKVVVGVITDQSAFFGELANRGRVSTRPSFQVGEHRAVREGD